MSFPTPILEVRAPISAASFTQHGTTSTLDHVIAVAYSSLAFAMNNWYPRLTSMLLYVVRFFMTTTSMIGTIAKMHQQLARIYASPCAAREDLDSPVEEGIILHHMFPLVSYSRLKKRIVTTRDKAFNFAETLTGESLQKMVLAGFSTPESDFQGTTNSKWFNDYMDYGNLVSAMTETPRTLFASIEY